ncbi:MAG: HEAT repeat domain-containing protein [Firmicutes bacterium]|nr:HEAT repeat domain-containing protein [Bacillota bacterium]
MEKLFFEEVGEVKEFFDKNAAELDTADFLDLIMFNWDDRFDYVKDSPIISYMENREDISSPEDKQNVKNILTKYMDDEDESLRAAVAKCLGFVAGDDLTLLEKLAADNDCIVRCEALESILRTAGSKAAGRMIAAFENDEDDLVRLIAVRQLLKMEDLNLTEFFVKAADDDCEEIAAESCYYLTTRNGRRIYRFLCRKYRKARSAFEKLCFSYALYVFGDRDKLKKVLSSLRKKGKRFWQVRKHAAIFLDYMSDYSDLKTIKLILKNLENALPAEPAYSVSYEIELSIKKIREFIDRVTAENGDKG